MNMHLRWIAKFVKRTHCTSVKGGCKVCVVGSGPAGFYFAQHLLKLIPESHVDMYEKLPVPFGLVRYGVAPDHPEVKNVINTFTKVGHHKNFNFFGNVDIGKDVSLRELKEAYHAVVLAYGCSEDAGLDIPGEGLRNYLSARRFVGWYNGLPQDVDLCPHLDTDTAVILGQGNVAVDVARILLTPVDLLKETDITSHALNALSESKIQTVYLVGRRGPLHVAFTIKEFREMTKLPDVRTVFRKEQLEGLEELLPDLPRPRKRLTELILKTAGAQQKGHKTFCPLFLRKPVEILGKSSVEGIDFCINEITDNIKGKVRTTEDREKLACGIVFRSIGYRGTLIDESAPLDERCRVIPQPGIYSAGWINTGPVGVILTTMNNAFQQASLLAQDISEKKIDTSETKPGYGAVKDIISKKGVTTVSFEGWEKIDQAEIENGKKLGKAREKLLDVNEMLRIGGDQS